MILPSFFGYNLPFVPVLMVDVRGMLVLMHSLLVRMEMSMIPVLSGWWCPFRMKMMVVTVIVPVSVIMYLWQMPVRMAVMLGQQDHDSGQHQADSRDEDQPWKIPEQDQSDDDPEYRVDPEV